MVIIKIPPNFFEWYQWLSGNIPTTILKPKIGGIFSHNSEQMHPDKI